MQRHSSGCRWATWPDEPINVGAGRQRSPCGLADLGQWWRLSTTADRLPVYRLLFEVFAHRLEHAVERSKRHKDFRFAVLTLDIDRSQPCPDQTLLNRKLTGLPLVKCQ